MKVESFVQLPLDEYEKLREAARQQDIPATITQSIIESSNGFMQYRGDVQINIDMRKLKLQICDQNGIDPYATNVHFY